MSLYLILAPSEHFLVKYFGPQTENGDFQVNVGSYCLKKGWIFIFSNF
jgi:hypothetical protein